MAQLVQLCVDSGPNNAAIAERQWWLRNDRPVYALAHVGKWIDKNAQLLKTRSIQAFEAEFYFGKIRERSCQRQQVARIRRLQSYATQQPFEIEHAFQLATQLLAMNRVSNRLCHGALPRLNLC